MNKQTLFGELLQAAWTSLRGQRKHLGEIRTTTLLKSRNPIVLAKTCCCSALSVYNGFLASLRGQRGPVDLLHQAYLASMKALHLAYTLTPHSTPAVTTAPQGPRKARPFRLFQRKSSIRSNAWSDAPRTSALQWPRFAQRALVTRSMRRRLGARYTMSMKSAWTR